MKKLICAASAAAFLFSVAPAFAETSTGTIKSVDPKLRTVILDTGEVFVLGENVSADSLQPGQKVSVDYSMGDDVTTARKVTIAK